MKKQQPKDGAAPKAEAKAKQSKPATTNPPRRRGRPTKYTQALADQMCAELSQGVSLRAVCKSDSMPSTVTVFSWFRIYPEFLNQYARAKEESADALFDEIQDIADDGTNDWMEQHDSEGKCVGYKLNGEHVQRSRLRVDTRKWMMSKMKPKKYGERIQAEINVAPDYASILDAAIARAAKLAQERKSAASS